MKHRRTWSTAIGASLLAVALAACGGSDDESTTKGSTTSSSTSTSSTSSTTTPSTAPPTSPPTNPPVTGPQITSFNASPNFVVCQANGSASTTVSWSTANANQTTLSIDGPGIYGTYGPSGSVTSGPGCPPDDQSVTHTYTVTAKGPGGQTKKTISVKFQEQPG